MNYLISWLSVLALLSCFYQSECIATFSIDLSSEFIKVAIVKPGVPMEIALDSESQRKTPSVVYLHKNERLFGNAALNMGIKNPKSLYHSITTLIGKNIDHPSVQLFIKNFPYYDLFMNENNQLSFKHDENISYTVEELLAMIIENAKGVAEKYSEMDMKGGVIVVPPYYTQEERLSVLRSAKIAGINVLQLMNSNTAVGLNYGIFRRKAFNATVQYYMFYDVGSSATVASIVAYQVVKVKEFGMMVENPQLSVIGLSYDRTLGTSQFILRLQEHLAKAFNKMAKPSKDVKTVPRSMAKLYKEASRVLKVLSANNEIFAQVENVLEEKDLKVKVTRAEFEEMCRDLFDRFTEPIHKCLESAQIPMPVIKELILMGGGTRIPRLQELLLRATDLKDLGKSINTDEAAALGGVYQAAHVSPGFKVKTFIVKDANLVPIAVDFFRFKTQENKEVAHFTSRMIFDKMNLFPMKRVLTFNKHIKNFDFNVSLGTVDTDKDILFRVTLTNLTDVHTDYMQLKPEYKTEFKGVKAHFGLDNSGLALLHYVEALFERTWNLNHGKNIDDTTTLTKIGNTISNLFGSGSSSEEPKAADTGSQPESGSTQENTIKNTTGSNGTDSANKTGSSSPNNETGTPSPDTTNKTAAQAKIETIHQNLRHVIEYRSSMIVSDAVVEASRARLVALKKIDDEKVDLERAQNELESYIFTIRNLFDKDVYFDCSTESERQLVIDKAQVFSDWYEEQSLGTPKEEYTSRYRELHQLMTEIDFRVKELTSRSEAIGRLNTILNHSNNFLENFKNLTGEGRIFTQAEYNSLAKLIDDTTKWFANTNKTFEKMKLYENPTVTTADFEPHIRALEREIGYLLNKVSIWKSQVPPNPQSPNSSTTDTKSSPKGEENTTSQSTEKKEQTKTDSDDTKKETKPPTSTDKDTTTKESPPSREKSDMHVDL